LNPTGEDFGADRLAWVLFSEMGIPREVTLYVGFSGGADSTALVHAAAAIPGPRVIALHAHHGIAPDADAWEIHCRQFCQSLELEYRHTRLAVSRDPDRGWEASARTARYRWFASVLKDGDYLLTAHHRDDQAETVLGNLLRGSGVSGLSGIHPRRPLGRGTLVRPLLQFAPEALRAYLAARKIAWIEDPMNQDARFTRTRLRNKILPELERYWPAVRLTLAATADRLQNAETVLRELASIDLGRLETGGGDALSLAGLRQLIPARQANAIREWLRRDAWPMPDARHMNRVIHELINAETPPTAVVEWGGVEIRHYREQLFRVMVDTTPLQDLVWDLRAPLDLPGRRGRLMARRVQGGGLAHDRLRNPVEVRWRRGGESCRLPGRSMTHRLKKLLQEAHVPPWKRNEIPLIYSENTLAAVVGYWYCAPFASGPAEEGWAIDLDPRAPVPDASGPPNNFS